MNGLYSEWAGRALSHCHASTLPGEKSDIPRNLKYISIARVDVFDVFVSILTQSWSENRHRADVSMSSIFISDWASHLFPDSPLNPYYDLDELSAK